MCDAGFSESRIVSIDPNFDEALLKQLTHVFPQEWFHKLSLIKGTSAMALKELKGQKFDLVYIDGDHSADAVLNDWEHCKDLYTKFIIFDDYIEEEQPGIAVKSVVDKLEEEKELLIMDRRIFFDDRRIPDDEINYGQVLIKHPDFDDSEFMDEW